MKIIPPPEDIAASRESATQAVYSLIMNVAEVTAQGKMPDRGPASMTKLQAAHIVDTIVHLVLISSAQGICPMCKAMQESAIQHGLTFESTHHSLP